MNSKRIALATVAGWVTYFVYGGLVFGMMLAPDYRLYPSVFRAEDEIPRHMAIGIVCSLTAIIVLSIMYAKGYEGGSGIAEGARFGLLVGVFSACTHIADNYVVLQIGGALAAKMWVASVIEWTLVGTVIGLVYRRPAIKGGVV